MILMIDNYDSFTYNLVHYLGELGEKVLVFRNDKITLEEIGKLNPDIVVVSPGPCTPKEAGISVDLIKEFAGRIPILGVCLGHQSIGYAFGGNIVRAQRLLHGKTSQIYHDEKGIYEGVPDPFEATRYHLDNYKLLPKAEKTSWISTTAPDAWKSAESGELWYPAFDVIPIERRHTLARLAFHLWKGRRITTSRLREILGVSLSDQEFRDLAELYEEPAAA